MPYHEWIESYVSRQPEGFVRGKCLQACSEMRLQFPELRLAAGFAHVTWGREEHWWCVAPDGSVVDPTKSQFQFGMVLRYEELDLNDPKTRDLVPVGKCMNCGDETYTSSLAACMCSDSCAKSFEAYLKRELQP